METGRIIEFWENKRIIAAVCLEVKGDRLHILTENNREASLSANRVVHSSDYRIDLGLSRDEIIQKLKIIIEKRNKLKQETSVSQLWELLQGEGSSFTGNKLAELWYGKGISSDYISALQRALADDKIYFRLKGEEYLLNPTELVEQHFQKLERDKEKLRETEELSQWLKQTWNGQILPLTPTIEKFIEILKQIALFGQDAPEYKRGKEILEKAELITDLSFKILVKLGIWKEDENLTPHKYLVPIIFPEAAFQEIDSIYLTSLEKDLDEDRRRVDLTSIDLFSIDSETTQDIDDALSLEEDARGGWQLGIHIADVAHYITPGGLFDQLAMERATSIYLPETKIPMLPYSLSEGLISLNPHERKRALSLMVRLNEEGEVLDFSFYPSWVKVGRRMSYDGVDSLLEREDTLKKLFELAQTFRQRRLKAGALNFTVPELEISVNEKREISFVKRERETPSQIMVSECMILSNNLAAEFCRSRKIPLINRSQAKPAEELPPLKEHDPLIFYRLRRMLSRAELSTIPKAHAGLGLDSYTNYTSPIRRYSDLVVERQILSSLRNQPPAYTEEELKNIIYTLEPALSRANVVQQESKRYWLYKYLESRIGEEISATVLDALFNRYIIWLEPYLMEADLSMRGNKEIKSGDAIIVRLDSINARDGYMKLSLVLT